jgi:hypothetical protein
MEIAMNDELTKCYAVLGLSPGVSAQELKATHRDLSKVWHPDRFLHDPRLQEKAQEKLKEINEAYDQLRSGKAKRHTQPPSPTSQRHAPPTTEHFDPPQRIRWQFILAPVLIFGVAFLATSRSLLRRNELPEQSQVPSSEQAEAPPDTERQQAGSLVNTSANELPRGKDRIEGGSQREDSSGASTSQPSTQPLRPLPTVTVVIDPTTGMIARSDCPVKSRMTYPVGNEPHQYCNASHPATTTAPADALSPKESRLKSAAKRLTSPGKWFPGKAKSDAGDKHDSNSP